MKIFQMIFKSTKAFILGFCLAYSLQCFGSVQPKITISILQTVEHPALDATRQGIIDELKNQNIIVDFQSAQGNAALSSQIAQKFVGNHTALMVGIGTSAAQSLLAANQNQTIPIVFASVTDPKAAKLLNDLVHPEGKITGVSNFINSKMQFDFFKKVMPSLNTLGIIYNPGEPNSVALLEDMKKAATEKNLKLIFAPANSSVEVLQATQTLINQVQAIFINNDNTALSAFDAIVKMSTAHKIPVFCSDIDMISHGAFAALGPNQYKIGRQAGKMILKILQGEDIKNLPVSYPQEIEPKLNRHQMEILDLPLAQPITEKL